MTLGDIFKSGFLENTVNATAFDMLFSLVLSFGVGVFIFMIYKKACKGVMYSAGFGVTLIALTMITAFVILAVTNNIILSLGMVGVLSIVRFRTAVKEPLDIVFLFWAIAAGIVLAAGMIPLAVFGSAAIGLFLAVFVSKKAGADPYMAFIACKDKEAESEAMRFIGAHVLKCVVKSKSASKGSIEVNCEIRLIAGNTDFMIPLLEIEGVKSAVLVSSNAGYLG